MTYVLVYYYYIACVSYYYDYQSVIGICWAHDLVSVSESKAISVWVPFSCEYADT